MDWQDGEQIRDATPKEVTNNTDSSPLSIDEGYDLLQRGEWSFMFTRIDAVYVWTQGGYQVGREPDDYPLFLAVREQDVDAWETFFEWFDLPTAFERQPRDELDGPLQIVLEPRASLDIEHVEQRGDDVDQVSRRMPEFAPRLRSRLPVVPDQ